MATRLSLNVLATPGKFLQKILGSVVRALVLGFRLIVARVHLCVAFTEYGGHK